MNESVKFLLVLATRNLSFAFQSHFSNLIFSAFIKGLFFEIYFVDESEKLTKMVKFQLVPFE